MRIAKREGNYLLNLNQDDSRNSVGHDVNVQSLDAQKVEHKSLWKLIHLHTDARHAVPVRVFRHKVHDAHAYDGLELLGNVALVNVLEVHKGRDLRKKRFDRVLEPRLGALKSDGAVGDLLGEVALLVLDAMLPDNRRDRTKLVVCCVHANLVDSVENKLEPIADRLGALGGTLFKIIELVSKRRETQKTEMLPEH